LDVGARPGAALWSIGSIDMCSLQQAINLASETGAA